MGIRKIRSLYMNNICLTNLESKLIQDYLKDINTILSNASNRNVCNKLNQVDPNDLHKVFRDQFGFGKLR